MTFYKKPFLNALVTLTLVFLSGCAGKYSVPGGTEDVNANCFSSVAEMQARVIEVQPGMAEADVLGHLCHKKESLQRLDRRDIRIAVLGGDNVLFNGGADTDADSELIRSLYGYKLSYKSVKRKHGFTSPIRIRTDEAGFNYTVTLIFKDGILFEEPTLSGGLVNNVRSGTIFDFITPGTIIDHAVPN